MTKAAREREDNERRKREREERDRLELELEVEIAAEFERKARAKQKRDLGEALNIPESVRLHPSEEATEKLEADKGSWDSQCLNTKDIEICPQQLQSRRKHVSCCGRQDLSSFGHSSQHGKARSGVHVSTSSSSPWHVVYRCCQTILAGDFFER